MTVDDYHLIIGKQQVKIEQLESDVRTAVDTNKKLIAANKTLSESITNLERESAEG